MHLTKINFQIFIIFSGSTHVRDPFQELNLRFQISRSNQISDRPSPIHLHQYCLFATVQIHCPTDHGLIDISTKIEGVNYEDIFDARSV